MQHPLTIGFSDSSGARHDFTGLIDEVELFNRALSADEIRDIYMAGSLGKRK